ncbi:MAG: hypothetical protein AB7O59_10945 [Pirellulales bacterium]
MTADSSHVAPRGFDFTFHMRRLCAELCAGLNEFSHVQFERVALRFCQVRNNSDYGVLATLTPLRFEHGAPIGRRGGQMWTIRRVHDAADREMLYLLSFYLPRFLNRPFHDKLSTVIHELWHIGPRFDGDVRRHPGRCYAHGRSAKHYDASMAALADKWLALDPPQEMHAFLQYDFRQLERRYGRVFGQTIPTPRLTRL